MSMSMLVPDFPFSYDTYLAHPAGLGSLPADAHGTPVAIIGGGLAGVICAHELLKLGARPVVYESAALGGRMRTARFPDSPAPPADLGAMRFPRSSRALFHYIDQAGLRTAPFPNPLAPATPSTVIELGGERHYARTAADLPPLFHEVSRCWEQCLRAANGDALRAAIAQRDHHAIKDLWNPMVARLDDESFYGFLARAPGFAEQPFRYREMFGQVGFGTGGWDTDFPNSILEVLRVVLTGADEDHHRIVAGADALPRAIWRLPLGESAHWPAGTSVATVHPGGPRMGARRIHRDARGEIAVTDMLGNTASYAAVIVTCQTWLLSARIDCDEGLFHHDLWSAMERSHYMQSSKTFVTVDRPFWRDIHPGTGQHAMSMTLTDRLTRATSLLEDQPNGPATICLSYTWNDDALKWLALDPAERVRLMLHSLRMIYPDVDIAAHIRGEPITVSWESDPNFMGAFKNNLPGHYRYQQRLFTHFMQDSIAPQHRGIYLAGDDISFTAGWAEGAVTTALNAVWAVQRQLGGRACSGNPGPGDVFDELAPLVLGS
ncbi:FAD-dependent oxidoreductase [Hoyosella sp. G463]|uniref:FAD-dependent oxidoreductase n=1 Tax=Lolliginicoccus lacisalsi TaxID=2742202 RepID=A0A927PLF2_9ACTN|nr:NAD(P)/FAD-dependent oxidoreductase [Lolliginicoccus lacisalsi]MBD8507050.1 FAD-dependent oxidoreductase [Lolliginicoccus lacisalsi]